MGNTDNRYWEKWRAKQKKSIFTHLHCIIYWIGARGSAQTIEDFIALSILSVFPIFFCFTIFIPFAAADAECLCAMCILLIIFFSLYSIFFDSKTFECNDVQLVNDFLQNKIQLFTSQTQSTNENTTGNYLWAITD